MILLTIGAIKCWGWLKTIAIAVADQAAPPRCNCPLWADALSWAALLRGGAPLVIDECVHCEHEDS